MRAFTAVLAEADVPADLLDGDAPLGDHPSDEALGYPETGGDLGDVQKPDGILGVVGSHDHCKPWRTLRGDTCQAGSS